MHDPISQNATIRIEEVNESHLPQILEIYNYYVLNSTANWDFDTRSLSEQQVWFRSLKSKEYPVLVALESSGQNNSKVVGYCNLGEFRSKAGYAK